MTNSKSSLGVIVTSIIIFSALVVKTESKELNALLTLIGILGLPAFLFFRELFRSFGMNVSSISRSLKKNIHVELLKYSSYYKGLNSEQQDRFQKRVIKFIRNRYWVGKDGLIVTEEMQLNIAITAVTLTFGLDKMHDYHELRKIILLPDLFTSGMNKTLKKGETNPQYGHIIISWKSYLEDMQNSQDGINIGIHELAHALYMNQNSSRQNEEFQAGFKIWIQYADELSKAGQTQTIFRKEAYVNHIEFFAVALELFFETPSVLKEQVPCMYNALVLLLNQDPLSAEKTIIAKDITENKNYEIYLKNFKENKVSQHPYLKPFLLYTFLILIFFAGVAIWGELVFLASVSILGVLAFYFFRSVLRAFGLPISFVSAEFKLNLHKELETKSPYYRALEAELQQKFQKRVLKFIQMRNWSAKDGLKLTEEIKLEIAITAVQISFGLEKKHDYRNYHTIRIYPEDYLSTQSNKKHKGETSLFHNYISISLKSFLEGNKNSTDTINVGIHEFAHALYINQKTIDNNESFSLGYEEWVMHVNKFSNEGKTQSVFRKYAFTNQMEFFAVALEYFFENPAFFKEKLPVMYQSMTSLLQQDPLLPNNGIIVKR